MKTLTLVCRRAASHVNEPGSTLLSAYPCSKVVHWDDTDLTCLPPLSSDALVLDFSESEEKIYDLARCRSRPANIPILAIVASEVKDEFLMLATKLVDDVVQLPCSASFLISRVDRLLTPSLHSEVEVALAHLLEEFGLKQLIGNHPSLKAVVARIPIVARSELPTLILGETGTGKELCARAIHALSSRRDRLFVPVECGAIPDNLAESEMFGHTRGAFTDAKYSTVGVVGTADRGTLFLDEIDSLSLVIQAKLLRFLQEGTYRPLGSDQHKRADVRIIAASNRSLLSAIAENQFRRDLFFRLSVLRLELPPLRERRSDIPLLAAHFMNTGRPFEMFRSRHLSTEAIKKLELHDWPGNVRELSNVINRAVLFSAGPEISSADIIFDQEDVPSANALPIVEHTFRQAKTVAVNSFEKGYLASLLKEHAGNITRAAKAAGQDRTAFRRLLKKHGLHTPDAS